MEDYQQKIDDLLRKARAQGAARAARTKRTFITNIVVTPKEEERPKEELKSLKDIWRNMNILDSRNSTSTIRFRKTGKSTKGKNSKTKKSSSGNKNHREELQLYRTNMENIPVQPFVGFRRNKTPFPLEKCKEDTPTQLDKKYTLPADSPSSDQSSDTSPLKNVRKPVITNYFQRMGINSPDTVRSDTISSETDYTMISSTFSENSSFTSDENGDVLMTSAASSPDRQVMILSDDEEISAKEGKTMFKVTKNTTTTHICLPFPSKITLDQTSEQKPDHGITPPNRNPSVIGYFQKGKRQQRSTEIVTGEKLNNNLSPDTLRILATAQSDGKFEELDNPFISRTSNFQKNCNFMSNIILSLNDNYEDNHTNL